MHTVFGLRLRGDVTAFLVGSVLFLFTVISFGVMVGVRVPEQASALQAMQLGGFVLSYLLSGFIFPLSNVPSPLRVLSNLTPARYYLVIVRDAFLRGGGWPAVWPHVSALLLLFLTFFGLAWRRIRRMQLEA
ncbi:MAG: ABC transporter permease [Proteobacteria bacterium]|nr:ABC transporter permease [Pseudomonadota bacterium]